MSRFVSSVEVGLRAERNAAIARAEKYLADMNDLERLWMKRRDAAISRAEEWEGIAKAQQQAKDGRAERAEEQEKAWRNACREAEARAERAEREASHWRAHCKDDVKQAEQAEAQLAGCRKGAEGMRQDLVSEIERLEAQLAEAREAHTKDCHLLNRYREALERIAAEEFVESGIGPEIARAALVDEGEDE